MRDDVSTALPGKEVDFKREYLMITLMTFSKSSLRKNHM